MYGGQDLNQTFQVIISIPVLQYVTQKQTIARMNRNRRILQRIMLYLLFSLKNQTNQKTPQRPQQNTPPQKTPNKQLNTPW